MMVDTSHVHMETAAIFCFQPVTDWLFIRNFEKDTSNVWHLNNFYVDQIDRKNWQTNNQPADASLISIYQRGQVGGPQVIIIALT